MQRMEFRAMGSRILAVLDGEGYSAREGLQPVAAWFEEWEASLSRFRPDSELNRLNRSADKEAPVSPVMYAVVAEALQAAAETEGLTNPLLRDAVLAAGYNRPFDPANPPGGDAPPEEVLPCPDWEAVRLDRSPRCIRLPLRGSLDLGGIAKGWAADTAAARLARLGPALVDAGGDISISGPKADGSPWPVGVTNPFFPDDVLCTLALLGGGAATSGRDYRTWFSGGILRHHVIDPRTMRPAETDALTATVLAPSARRAESAAKAALILGSRSGIDWLDGQSDLAGMMVLEDRRIVYSRRFAEYVWN